MLNWLLDPRNAPHPLAGVDHIKAKYIGRYEEAFAADKRDPTADARNEAGYEEITEADSRTYEYRVKEASVLEAAGGQPLGKEFEKLRNQASPKDMEEIRDVRETEHAKQEVRESRGPFSPVRQEARQAKRQERGEPTGPAGTARLEAPGKEGDEEELPEERTLYNGRKEVRRP